MRNTKAPIGFGILAFAATAAVACDDDEPKDYQTSINTNAQLLAEQASSLNALREELLGEIQVLRGENESLRVRLAALEPLADVLTIDESGDVVIEGANLHVRNGTGMTECGPPCNGKGNVIIGYQIPTGECSDSASLGAVCSDDSYCTCEYADNLERSGSHNLVIGPENRYTSYAGIAGGPMSTLRAPYAAALGGARGVVESRGGVIVSGHRGHIESGGEGGLILSGSGGVVRAPGGVILAGYEEVVDRMDEVVPRIPSEDP